MPICTTEGKPLRVGFVGAGMMAGAMIRGLVTSSTCSADNMIASDAYRPCLDTLAADLKMKVTDENTEVANSADVVFIAVKPQQVQDVCASIAKSGANPIVVSIAAGVTLDSLGGWLPTNCRIVRVMPNTPCMVGELAAGYAPNAACSDADAALVGSILGALGTAFKEGSAPHTQEWCHRVAPSVADHVELALRAGEGVRPRRCHWAIGLGPCIRECLRLRLDPRTHTASALLVGTACMLVRGPACMGL